MYVKIVDTPTGEAPLEVRQAWVGLVLPLWKGQTGAGRFVTQGVLTGPRSLLGKLLAWLLGRTTKMEGYAVNAAAAHRILAQHDASAAQWWQTHAPRSLAPGNAFVFNAKACELSDSPEA